ncbi:hypothetical protein ACJJTC_017152 [Scirpophaga incertulas]
MMSESKSTKELQKQVEQFRQWAESQAHFPKNLEDRLLRRFVHSCYYDMDKAKAAAELFFTLRASCPELLNDRDPLSPQMQKVLKMINLATLNISGNRKLWVWQLNDPGLEQFDYIQDVRMFFMTTDAWLLTDDMLEDADIAIMDVKDISLKFITKFNVSVARKLSKYQEDAIPIRLKQIHLVNAPPFIDKIFNLMKPFLKQDMTDMIHFHTPKSNTLHNFFSKDELPEDYGGTNGKMEDHMKNVVALLNSQRDLLCNNDLWKAQKKSKNKTDDAKDIGTFRTLDID